jgi:hypothetical protein
MLHHVLTCIVTWCNINLSVTNVIDKASGLEDQKNDANRLFLRG